MNTTTQSENVNTESIVEVFAIADFVDWLLKHHIVSAKKTVEQP